MSFSVSQPDFIIVVLEGNNNVFKAHEPLAEFFVLAKYM